MTAHTTPTSAFESVRRFLTPPTLTDDRQAQAARMLHKVAVSTALIVTAIIPLVVVVQPDTFWRAVRVVGVVDALVPVTLLLNRRGRQRLAGWIFIGVILAMLTFNALSTGGIRSPGVQAYFVIVMLAGLLLGQRRALLVGVLCAGLGLALVVGEWSGALPAQTMVYNAPARWLLNCLYISISLLIMRLGTGAIRDSLSRAEVELQERRAAQRRLTQALDAGAIGTFDQDLRTNLFHGDARALAITGLTAGTDGTVPYDEWQAVVHPDDRQRVLSVLDGFAHGLHHGRTSYRVRRPDGAERHLESAAYLTTDDRGQPASIVGMILDVTARKEAEREREHLVLNLGERVKELRLLHSAAQLLQQDRPADHALLAELLAMIPPAWLHADDCQARIVYQNVEVTSPGWRESPWRQTAAFGTSAGLGAIDVVYLNEHASADEGPFLAEERALLQSLAEMLRSHIEERVAEMQRRDLESQLRQAQKMEALGTLAGGIAHDFNNILTAIGGNADLALAGGTHDEETRQSLTEIAKAQARARELVKRILLFSRREESVHKAQELPPVVSEAVQLLRASLPANIRIVTTIAPDLPAVLADSTQIHQVIMNLGTNAAYAMGDTGGTLSVNVDLVTIGDVASAPSADLDAGPHIRLAVRDTGTGMSQAVLERLFEPFFTTKGHAGTGLGLSVVHGIVRDHHGAITVESELGRGTVFRIYLPVVAGVEVAAPEVVNVIRGAGQHIMYLDDEAAIVLLMSRTLDRLGYQCTGFTSVDAALQEFRTNPRRFDAVVTDMQMPVLSGLEFARAVHQIRPEIPVAIASGYTPEEGKAVTTVRWIQKPTPLAALSLVLQEMLASTTPRAGAH